jgi:cell volume regulation protein A
VGVGGLALIGLFVLLGLLVSRARTAGRHVVIAVLAGLLLTFVARPLSVLACTWSTGMSARAQVFVSWAGLRGAVPIVLSTIPLAENVPRAEELFDIVFVMVVVYTLVTGPTLPWVASKLGVMQRGEARDLDVEAAPLENIAADLLQVKITRHSQLHGVEVAELRLPVGVSVSLIVRDGQSLVPDQRTVLRHGDDLLVVAPRKLREQAEDRLRAVSLRGRLADWLDGPTG